MLTRRGRARRRGHGRVFLRRERLRPSNRRARDRSRRGRHRGVSGAGPRGLARGGTGLAHARESRPGALTLGTRRENPGERRGSMAVLKPASPQAVVIFGASGDLTRRKLLPAFWHLFSEGLIPRGVAIVGYARTEMPHEEWQEYAREQLRRFAREDPSGEEWDEFRKRLSYVAGEFANDNAMEDLR